MEQMGDAMVNSVEDYLIDDLSCKLSPGASYVTDRRSVKFHPLVLTFTRQAQGPKLYALIYQGTDG